MGLTVLTGAAVSAALLWCPAAHAAVVESTAAGFAIQQTVHITAPADRVYAALITPAKWWNSEHTFSGSAANLSLDARAGGCFCETWNGGSVQHLTVVDAQPGRILRLRGALGPFQGQGADGSLTFTLKVNAGGTDVAPGPSDPLADEGEAAQPVDGRAGLLQGDADPPDRGAELP